MAFKTGLTHEDTFTVFTIILPSQYFRGNVIGGTTECTCSIASS